MGQDREQTAHVTNRQAWGDIVAHLRNGPMVSCTKPDDLEHRASVWRLPADRKARLKPGPLVCGVCHPAPAGIDHELVPLEALA